VRIIQAHGEWVRDENGKPIKMYGAAQDITERRRAEEALKESEERFRQVYEGMAVGVARVSPASQIEAANEAYCRMLGYREEELIGKHLRDITHPETIEANLRKQAQLAAGEINHYRMEKRFIHKDGHVVHGILDANLVRDAEGNPLYSLGSVVDITDRRRMEEQLHQQERLAAVGQLAGGIAHDFNNILAAIILYAQMPLRRPDLPSAVRNALQTILKESRRAADLIQQILDFSRSGMMKTEALSLGAVVTETLMLLRRTIPEHIRLVTETTAHPCSVQADRTRIQQVLMNLALNAKDAMPEGGELRITVAPVKVAPQDEPPLPDMAPGSWVCLSISDSGIGMNEKVQDHLFEPFFTTKEPGKGTGLGLAQVYGIVKQHEGFIGVDTAVGEGTTFTIFLPLVDDRDEEDAADSGTTALRGRGETILVVEDAERLRRALRAGLEYLEYHVITAANGHEALETVSLQDVDLVLTDLVMPKMGGEELLRSLRAEDPNLRVIALTGHVMDRDVTELKAAGFADAVSKPFSIEDLSRVIRDVLDSEG
jgi:PAS domain S-box-containing protein